MPDENKLEQEVKIIKPFPRELASPGSKSAKIVALVDHLYSYIPAEDAKEVKTCSYAELDAIAREIKELTERRKKSDKLIDLERDESPNEIDVRFKLSGADLEFETTLLCRAINKRNITRTHIMVVEAALAAGADPNVVVNNETALMRAAVTSAQDSLEIIKILLASKKTLVNAKNEYNHTALYQVARLIGDILFDDVNLASKKIKLLVDAGADPSFSVDRGYSSTALGEIADRGRLDLVQVALTHPVYQKRERFSDVGLVNGAYHEDGHRIVHAMLCAGADPHVTFVENNALSMLVDYARSRRSVVTREHFLTVSVLLNHGVRIHTDRLNFQGLYIYILKYKPRDQDEINAMRISLEELCRQYRQNPSCLFPRIHEAERLLKCFRLWQETPVLAELEKSTAFQFFSS